MIFPELGIFNDIALLFLRIITGIVFITSGWSHFTEPGKRSKSIGMSKNFTFFLGLGELSGAAGIILGVFSQFAAAVLVVVMLGAISKKIFVWKTGFYAEKGFGWHYDMLLLTCNLIIITSSGGNLTLIP